MTATARDATGVAALGTLADGVVGSGASSGRLQVEIAGIEIDWWIGADDGWKIPSMAAAAARADETVSTVRPGLAPAIESHLRVPGGEVVLRAYAVAHAGAPFVVADLENASPAAAVVAWVVRAAPGYRIGRVAIDGSTLLIDERARVELPRAPSRWAVAARAVGVHDAVVDGRADAGRFEPVATRRGDLEVAVLFPIAHRTRTRIAATTGDVGIPADSIAVARLPALSDVERGWVVALERGARVELPDETLQALVDAARATLLLGNHGGGTRRDRVVAAASDAWGLTDRAPRRFDGRDPGADPWPRLKATIGEAGSSPRRAAEWLRELRNALVRVSRDRIDLLPHFPVEWLGRPIAMHDVPSRHGPVSFAVRWHGARPALLWDVPVGVEVAAPGLDPSWNGAGGAGEMLLAEIDPTRLLPLRTANGADPGVVVEEPGSFT
jgi:hypothetical protein